MNHPKRLTKAARAGLAFCALAALCVAPARAVTLQTFVNGYFGGNYLSDGTTYLPNTTVVDFGFFYSGGNYTSASTIGTSLLALNGDSASLQSFRANNNWVSLGSGQVSGGIGDFTLQWNAAAALAGPGFGANLELNPTTGALSGQDLVGKTPFVWIQTPGSAPEFWVGTGPAFQTPSFGAFYDGNVLDGTFTMVYGKALSDAGVTTIPEPGTMALFALGSAGLLALRRRPFGKK